MSVLLNNCFPFSIKIPVKYNRVLLVVNKMAKIPLLHKHLKDVFIKKNPGTVMQIEKALKNDHLHVSKVP